MRRGVQDKTILEKFTEDFCRVIEKHCKYIVCSGFVAIAHGRTRGTEDIDMIIEKLSREKFIELHNDLEDAKHLRIIYEGKIDEEKINKIKEQIRRVRYGK